jgi:hypothetical protein
MIVFSGDFLVLVILVKTKYKSILVQSWFTLCTNVINVMRGAFRLWEVHIHMGVHFSYGRCISVMIMFMRREYIIGYSYTFHMLKIASSYQCYERCISVMGGAYPYGSAFQLWEVHFSYDYVHEEGIYYWL